MLGAERLHQWGNLVQVVPRHGGKEAEGAGGQSECNAGALLFPSSYSPGGTGRSEGLSATRARLCGSCQLLQMPVVAYRGAIYDQEHSRKPHRYWTARDKKGLVFFKKEKAKKQS